MTVHSKFIHKHNGNHAFTDAAHSCALRVLSKADHNGRMIAAVRPTTLQCRGHQQRPHTIVQRVEIREQGFCKLGSVECVCDSVVQDSKYRAVSIASCWAIRAQWRDRNWYLRERDESACVCVRK